MSVRINKYITDIDEKVILTSRLFNTVSGVPDTSDFINDRPRSVFQTVEDEILQGIPTHVVLCHLGTVKSE